MNNKDHKISDKSDKMTMILPGDLQEYLSNYDNQIYDIARSKDDESHLSLKSDIYEKLDNIYELGDKTDNFSEAKLLYLKNFVDTYLSDKILEFNDRIKNRITIMDKLNSLKDLELPEQRSEEWYAIRETILTASSLADAIGEGHFSTKDQLLIQKCGGPRGDIPFQIVEWGVMYEPVATKFYERMNQLTILEFGLVPHPEFKIFGASPDGICDSDSPPDYIGRMLEIKCPPKRQFTKEVPSHYWMQMQGQLECCDLEECDFLQVKFIEYSSEKEYNDDLLKDGTGGIKEGYTSNNLPKGLLLAFVRDPQGDSKNPTIHYEYCDFYQSRDELRDWSSKVIEGHPEVDYDRVVEHWWKIERYECTLVGRDRKWWLSVQPKIIDFWEDVLHYREVGIQVFHDLKAEKRTKKIRLKKPSQKKKNTFSIDKAVVEQIQNNYLIDSD
jgi:putative phage-type endonuclease